MVSVHAMPLGDAQPMYEVEEAIRVVVNRVVVGPDGLPVDEHLTVLVNEGDSDTLTTF